MAPTGCRGCSMKLAICSPRARGPWTERSTRAASVLTTSRRLAVFVGAVFAAESAFYSVVPPLVPRLVHDAHLTTTEVGYLVAAYPAGVLLAAIPSIALVGRPGGRFPPLPPLSPHA